MLGGAEAEVREEPTISISEAVAVRIEPAFLDGFERGRRFGVWIEPPAGAPRLGAILCIQPFGDEATLARRVLAAQARRLALRGWTTLIFDLFGTGDADGDTDDATLEQWRSDLLRASLLARERAPGSFVVWGTRMGALLGAELAATLDQGASATVFWQPPATGAALIDPLLKLTDVGAVARVRVAGKPMQHEDQITAAVPLEAVSGADQPPVPCPVGSPTQSTDQSPTDSPERILLAGYLLRRDLVDGLMALAMDPAMTGPRATPCPVLVLGIQRVLPASGTAPKALTDLAQHWREAGHSPTLRAVQGEPFWSSLEPSTPVAAFETTEAFLDEVAAVAGGHTSAR